MEIGRRFSLKYVFIGLYFVAFFIYVIIGLKPAEAVDYQVSAHLSIPSIGLNSNVTSLTLENGEIQTPDTIVGSYSGAENKTLLIGHSSTVFQDLNKLRLNDEIVLNDDTYIVKKYEVLKKENIVMPKLLERSSEDTIVIMTCAGKTLGGGDATHRLIITAERA